MKTPLTHTLLAALLCVVFTAEIRAQAGAFTYQGQLTENGSPASGLYDFTFTLYGSSGGMDAVAVPVTNSTVAVSNGLFTTTLDFGSGVFDGSNRWLEIGVATNGSGAFTNLAPRQQITSTPYAIRASVATLAESLPPSSVSGANIQNATITADKLVDSSGSGLDADLLDGLDSTDFAAAAHTHYGRYGAARPRPVWALNPVPPAAVWPDCWDGPPRGRLISRVLHRACWEKATPATEWPACPARALACWARASIQWE